MIRGNNLLSLFIVLLLAALPWGNRIAGAAGPDTDDFIRQAVVRIIAVNEGTYEISEAGGSRQELKIVDGTPGTGTVISEAGHIVTTAQCVAGMRLSDDEAAGRLDKKLEEKIRELQKKGELKESVEWKPVKITKRAQVVLPDGRAVPFTMVEEAYGVPTPAGGDPGRDVAVIKIQAVSLPAIRMDEAPAPEVAVFGYHGESLAAARIPLASYPASIEPRKPDKAGILKVNSNYANGFSGAPILDRSGRMAGMIVQRSNDGYVLAVPPSTLKEFADKAKVPPVPANGVTSRLQKGLSRLKDGDLFQAVNLLREIQKTAGVDPAISDQILEAEKKLQEMGAVERLLGRLDGAGPTKVYIGVGLFAAILAAAAGAAIYRRRKTRGRRRAEEEDTPDFIRTDSQPSGPPLGRPVLRGITGLYAGSVFPIDSGPAAQLVIGRNPQKASIVFPPDDRYKHISGAHCALRYDGSARMFVLEENPQSPSRNGTFTGGGERVTPGHPRFLRPGDTFYLVDPENTFEVGLERT